MKKHTLVALILYAIAILALLGTIYGLFNEKIELIIATLFLVVFALGFGHMLNSYTLKQKYDIDENVLHLTKEILHELAIPISTIQANSLLLKRSFREDEKALKRLSRIEDSTERLERLYEELLYSIKKEIKSVERKEIDLSSLVKERVEIMKQLHRNSFAIELKTCLVKVDKIGFEKMLDNLLTNAMKYSAKESEIRIVFKGKVLSIIDKGIGIEQKALRHVKKRYYQEDKNQKGEGIGLALVNAYCKDEKIGLMIGSTHGYGTEVKLDLSRILI